MQGALWSSNTKRATGRQGNPPRGLQRAWGVTSTVGVQGDWDSSDQWVLGGLEETWNSDRHWHFWDTGHQGNGTCSGLGVPGDQTPTDSGGLGISGHWGGTGLAPRRAVIPALATTGVCEMET